MIPLVTLHHISRLNIGTKPSQLTTDTVFATMSNLDITYPRGLEDSTRQEHIKNLQRRQTYLQTRVRCNILEDKLTLPDVVSYTEWKPVKRVLSLPQGLCYNTGSISQSNRKVGFLSLPNETLVMICGYLDAGSKVSFSFSCRALLIAASLHSRLVWVSRSHLLNIITPREHHSRHCAGCDRMRPIHPSYWNEPLDHNADVKSLLRWLIKAFESERDPAYITVSKCDTDLAAARSRLVRSWTSQDFGSSTTTSETEARSSQTLQYQDQDVEGQKFCPTCTAQRRCEDAKLRESVDKDAIYQCLQRAADGHPVGSWDSLTGRFSGKPV